MHNIYTIPLYTEHITPELPIASLTTHASIAAGISTVYYGDVGASGIKGIKQRRELLKKCSLAEHELLSVQQIHSMRIVLITDTKIIIWDGSWDMHRVVSKKILSYPISESYHIHIAHLNADGIIVYGKHAIHAIPSVVVADCVPLLLYTNQKDTPPLLGALHSGWKGTGILHVALQAIHNECAINSINVNLIIGPCIGALDYEVSEDIAHLFKTRFGTTAVTYKNHSVYVDLPESNIQLALSIGITNIAIMRESTYSNSIFCSYRREMNMHKTYKRMLCYIQYTHNNALTYND